jgi:site-specific recombinase XerD
MLSYDGYYGALKRYCREAEVPVIGTHGLRHSTSGVYVAHGASRDDLRKLFCHSSNAVTDLYVHDKGERLDQVARVTYPVPSQREEYRNALQRYIKDYCRKNFANG